MKTSYFQLAFLAASLRGCLAAPAGRPLIRARQWDHVPIVAPSNDTWYTSEPANLAAYRPGDVIAYRAAAIPTYFTPQQVVMAWQVKYRTTDSRSRPTWAVTTLYVPPPDLSATREPILFSYQQPYDSADVDRSPSYQAIDADSKYDYYYKEALPFIVNEHPGWYINMPDYEGHDASFSSGLISGQATLDSIRAVRRLGPRYTTMDPNIRFAMYGYSGGALATGWAAELQGSYAPELTGRAVAAVVGGLTPKITSVFYSIINNDTAYLNIIQEAVQGLSRQWPELRPLIVRAMNESSWDGLMANVKELVDNITTDKLEAFVDTVLGIEDVARVLRDDGVLGMRGPPSMDLYVYHSVEDQVAPVEDVRWLVRQYCGLRGRVQYQELKNQTHAGAGKIITWAASNLLADIVRKGTKLSGCVGYPEVQTLGVVDN